MTQWKIWQVNNWCTLVIFPCTALFWRRQSCFYLVQFRYIYKTFKRTSCWEHTHWFFFFLFTSWYLSLASFLQSRTVFRTTGVYWAQTHSCSAPSSGKCEWADHVRQSRNESRVRHIIRYGRKSTQRCKTPDLDCQCELIFHDFSFLFLFTNLPLRSKLFY